MAILSIVRDLKDLREKMGRSSSPMKEGKAGNDQRPGSRGAMCAWMRNTINPNLMSPTEYQPCLVHAGPFANIAVGKSSIIGDRVGMKMFEYHVTESGFAADIGFEKFWNVKSRLAV